MEDISVLVFPLFYHEESREGKRAVFNLRDFRQIFPDKTKSPERHCEPHQIMRTALKAPM